MYPSLPAHTYTALTCTSSSQSVPSHASFLFWRVFSFLPTANLSLSVCLLFICLFVTLPCLTHHLCQYYLVHRHEHSGLQHNLLRHTSTRPRPHRPSLLFFRCQSNSKPSLGPITCFCLVPGAHIYDHHHLARVASIESHPFQRVIAPTRSSSVSHVTRWSSDRAKRARLPQLWWLVAKRPNCHSLL